MEFVLIAVVTLVALGFVTHPILAKDRYLFHFDNMFDFGDTKQRRYLESKKQSTLENIKELDFEYEMGKLSEDDYSRLRQDYLGQAQETIHAIDKLKIREEIEELIEGEVRSRRRIQ